MTTLGTGIGTALLHNGVLIPNSEFGHIEIDGKDAETVASSGVRDKKGLSYKEWAPRLQKYYSTIEALFWPELFVVGGGGLPGFGQVPAPASTCVRRSCRPSIATTPASSGAAWLAAQTA